jgi:hypothetical protein
MNAISGGMSVSPGLGLRAQATGFRPSPAVERPARLRLRRPAGQDATALSSGFDG